MSKPPIPVDLLRRSCRYKKIIVPKSEKSSEKNDFSGDQQGVEKRIKIEPKTELQQDIDPEDYPQAHGHLEVHEDQLDLERTLLGGQSFRWTKRGDQKPIFTGVVLDHVLQLWRISQDKIAFKMLNNQTHDIKSSNVVELLKDYFHLKYDLKELYREWSSRDENLSKCCEQYRGFRILRQDPVENVFSFICATNNNIKRISQMIDKMCKKYGNILSNTDDDKSKCDLYRAFPSVERLAEEDVFQCLRYELGFGYRAKFITDTAKKIIKLSEENKCRSSHDYLLSLRQLSYKNTCKQLMELPGIGRKVADCICLMSMDHLNSVPIDCHIYEIVCRDYMPNLRLERKTLTESVHDMIGNYFKDLHGPLAGWSTSVLFIAELKHLKLGNKKEGKNERTKKKI